MNEAQPGPAEIAGWLVAVAEGRVDRDAADRWAARWVLDDTLRWDEVSWWALGLLHGIDLRSGPGEPYLHDDEQVGEWAAELAERGVTGNGVG
ncbi:hypothetical protein TR51_16710 [Kitasatospora griseola]|uniref:Uncharacterized protein n=1 Tax=Kitasatospora griseola TaxID=2064 RepID=A0A0D0PSJ0_KITGR|nr:hypothetical protein [Kitasatospora griseola]KIQ65509.1 hypothetical protein TR51_16710 [Kitasatospora griseola]